MDTDEHGCRLAAMTSAAYSRGRRCLSSATVYVRPLRGRFLRSPCPRVTLATLAHPRLSIVQPLRGCACQSLPCVRLRGHPLLRSHAKHSSFFILHSSFFTSAPFGDICRHHSHGGAFFIGFADFPHARHSSSNLSSDECRLHSAIRERALIALIGTTLGSALAYSENSSFFILHSSFFFYIFSGTSMPSRDMALRITLATLRAMTRRTRRRPSSSSRSML